MESAQRSSQQLVKLLLQYFVDLVVLGYIQHKLETVVEQLYTKQQNPEVVKRLLFLMNQMVLV